MEHVKHIIEAHGLSKYYGGRAALSNVSLNVARGTAVGLLGENGAGKTTTLECLLGIRRPDAGTVSVLGMNPYSAVGRKSLVERIGVQFQEAAYQDKITVGELCETTRALYQNGTDYMELLDRFAISDKAKTVVKELSGGQRQRLFLVLALIPAPEIVFFDELTTGLDARARREVWSYLLELKRRGTTMVLTSHFLDEVELLCDRICILRAGTVVFDGTVQEAMETSRCAKFEDAYLSFADPNEGGERA